MSEHPIWSEEAISFLALADAAVTVTAVKHGLKPAECVITADPPRWTKTAAGRLGNLWVVVRAWMTPGLAEIEQVNLWLYAFEKEPDGYDLDRDRFYAASERGAVAVQSLLDRLLERATSSTLAGLRDAMKEAQAHHNRDQRSPVFVPPGTKGFTN